MKNRLEFFLLLFVIISLTSCEKPNSNNVSLATQADVKFYMANQIKGDSQETDNNLPEYLNPDLTYDSITDIEGNIYRTIQIGTQTWMAENLRTSRYNDGKQITNVHFYNNDYSYKDTYGALYDHYVVNTGKLCPTGWHLPKEFPICHAYSPNKLSLSPKQYPPSEPARAAYSHS